MAFTTPGTAVAGEVLTAAFWNEQVRDNLAMFGELFTTGTNYTPALTASTTNPSLGSGGNFVQTGFSIKVGRLVLVNIRLRFGASGVSAGSGEYRFGLPAGRNSADIAGEAIGECWMQDENTGARQVGVVVGSAATYVTAQVNVGSGFTGVSNSVPWTWAASDFINLRAIYRSTA